MDNEVNNNIQPEQSAQQQNASQKHMKFCKYCGKQIDAEAVLCIHCGRQVEELKSAQTQATPQVIINNANNNTNSNINNNAGMPYGIKPKNKWVALLLCFFLGGIGVHKFYEGKVLLGIVYIFTLGLLGFGVFIDFIILLFKPNPYY